MSKLLVFDVDGTILDSNSFFDDGVREYEKIKNLPETNLEALHVGYSDPDSYDYGWGVDKEAQREILEDLYHYLNDKHKREVPKLFAGAKDGLIKLKDLGYKLAIATSKPGDLLDLVLDDSGIRDLFISIKSWADVEANSWEPKPAADMLNAILGELSFDKDNTLMIGDTKLDVLMGRNAGVKTIAVTWGGQSVEGLKEVEPTHIIDTQFSDILPLIEREFPL